VYGDALPVPHAVFLNSTMCHALDLDDVHLPASLHITSLLMPVVLGVGERVRASGVAVMDAFIVGIEVAGRVGREHQRFRTGIGFLPSSVVGGFGATFAACRLLGLDASQTVNAFGIFYAHASGNRQSLFELTLAKRIQPAIAAQAAVWAALLAARGFTGPEEVFEGEAGLFRIYGADGTPSAERILAARESYEVEWTTVKRFPTCGANHPAIQAALDLAQEHRFTADEIETVSLYLGEGGNALVGRPFQIRGEPQVAAQFCGTYAVAVALLRGRVGISEISNDRILHDEDIKDVAQRMKIVTHWDFTRQDRPEYEGYPDNFATPQVVRVTLTGGRSFTAERTFGSVFHPGHTDTQEVISKFHRSTGSTRICNESRSREIAEGILHLREVENVADFVRQLLVVDDGPWTRASEKDEPAERVVGQHTRRR
jgi:2-methylcitrate dehydratase PrpD